MNLFTDTFGSQPEIEGVCPLYLTGEEFKIFIAGSSQEKTLLSSFLATGQGFELDPSGVQYIILFSFFDNKETGACVGLCHHSDDDIPSSKLKLSIDFLVSRRHGHGTLLMKEMEKLLIERLGKNLEKNNIYIRSINRVVGFYESLGFVEIITEDDDDDEICRTMCKPINKSMPDREKIQTYEICEGILDGFATQRERLIRPYFKEGVFHGRKKLEEFWDYLKSLSKDRNDSEKLSELRKIMTVNVTDEELMDIAELLDDETI